MNDMQPDEKTPVLIGCGQVLQRDAAPSDACSPLDLMARSAELAARDAGPGAALWPHVDTVGVVRMIADSADVKFPFGVYPNAPLSLAQALGAPVAQTIYGPTGGNTPQALITHMARRIAAGEAGVALIAGAECLHTFTKARAQGLDLGWGGKDPGGVRQDLGSERDGVTGVERRHALQYPVNAYPLFENALRGLEGRSAAAQCAEIGRLFAPFSRIAAGHPQAWFPQERTAEEIATPALGNRYVGFPYTKYMNAVMRVDQGSALLMTSWGRARALGVAEDRLVFLHGAAGVNDIWFVSERVNFHSSPAIRVMGRTALDMAGWNIGDVDFFDLYSCFPCAVQIARNELGIPADDPRPLTVTGGLPYFGGAGNNYVTHAVATMMDRLRAAPGARGLCTGNGWLLTKHSIGLYSTRPPRQRWWEDNEPSLQPGVDAEYHPAADETPQGPAHVETYTVLHDRKGPQFGLVMGRLDATGARFIAHTPADPETLSGLMEQDCLGRSGSVAPGDGGLNVFTPGPA